MRHLLFSAVWLGLGATAALAQVNPNAPPPVVEEVSFEGARAISSDTLRAAVETRGSRCRSPLLSPVCALTDLRRVEQPFRLDSLVLRRDEEAIRTLYAARGYPSAQVEAMVASGGTALQCASASSKGRR